MLAGSIAGLVGSGLVLKNGTEAILTVPAGATAFAFPTTLGAGGTSEVTVFTQPMSPSQTCTVTSGAGNVGDAGAAGIAITCTTNKYAVGGTVAGLTSSGLVLRDNGGDNLPFPANASSFAFRPRWRAARRSRSPSLPNLQIRIRFVRWEAAAERSAPEASTA